MKKTLALIALLPTIFVSTTVFAQDFSAQIETRQNAFERIESLSKQADKTLKGSNTDWHALEQIGVELTRHSAQLQQAFPEGSQAESKAKKEVWSKPDNFNRLMLQMDEGFAQLYQAAQNQQVSSAEAGLKQAQSTCRSCHRAYRSRW
ncbi:c-type cytochrome [Vibrio owensii]|uniref:c-type cytochrome n=1 Tax=Vibrio owensii TaxID=696485 RepID=UPI0003A3B77F|nr:cytochrome c [Vibrio owensii]